MNTTEYNKNARKNWNTFAFHIRLSRVHMRRVRRTYLHTFPNWKGSRRRLFTRHLSYPVGRLCAHILDERIHVRRSVLHGTWHGNERKTDDFSHWKLGRTEKKNETSSLIVIIIITGIIVTVVIISLSYKCHDLQIFISSIVTSSLANKGKISNVLRRRVKK